MKISKVINALNAILITKGDLEVFIKEEYYNDTILVTLISVQLETDLDSDNECVVSDNECVVIE